MKKILITGAEGFIGKNLIEKMGDKYQILSFDKNNTLAELEELIKIADAIVHLAGSNRPVDVNEFQDVNFGLTEIITKLLIKYFNKTPIIFSSSTQAELDNPYGQSKKSAENLLIEFANINKSNIFILRLTNVFGKWCRPNYNSVVATFCYNIANKVEVKVNDKETILKLVYVYDVAEKIIDLIEYEGNHRASELIEIEPFHYVKLGELVDIIYSFKNGSKYKFKDKEFVEKLRRTYKAYESGEK